MLSTAGAQTRPQIAAPTSPEPSATPAPEAPAPEPHAPSATAAVAEPVPSGTVSPLPTVHADQRKAEDSAPRTLRLRPDTAARLRAAWLEAKRDDVLLTAQDFASDLVEDALARHRRRRAAAASS
jgi:hypothetical protein